LSSVGNWIADSAETVINAVWDWIKRAIEKIGEVVKAVGEWIGKAVATVAETVGQVLEHYAGGFEELGKRANQVLEALGKWLTEEPDYEEIAKKAAYLIGPMLHMQQAMSEQFAREALRGTKP